MGLFIYNIRAKQSKFTDLALQKFICWLLLRCYEAIKNQQLPSNTETIILVCTYESVHFIHSCQRQETTWIYSQNLKAVVFVFTLHCRLGKHVQRTGFCNEIESDYVSRRQLGNFLRCFATLWKDSIFPKC